MPLPASFAKEGYLPPASIKRRLMVGIDGPPDSGKSELAYSAPGPIIGLMLDRGLAFLDNPDSPARKRTDLGFKVIPVPMATQMAQPQYLEYWKQFYEEYKKALANADARAVVLDGDSDSWELQRLAEFGRLSKVPPNLYDNVNAARRAMYARAWDSQKIVIATNRIRKVYMTKMKADGITPETTNTGQEVRVWSGEYERQGFADQDYLWHIQVRTTFDANKGFGMKILKCKPNMSLVGAELWDEQCNFKSLVQTVYPNVPLKEWGFAA